MMWGTVNGRWQMMTQSRGHLYVVLGDLLCGDLSVSLGAVTLLSVLCPSRGGGHPSLCFCSGAAQSRHVVGPLDRCPDFLCEPRLLALTDQCL